ncbi:unnamed protein product [Tenebrio molitor]|nr:unnamed protein product [Tenebrio molitor]
MTKHGELRDTEGNNLLQISIILEKKKIFDYLLSLDVFPLEGLNMRGETPLYLALSRYSFNWRFFSEHYALELINKKACVNVSYPFKQTVLHLALQRHYIQVVHFLLRIGADPDVLDEFGDSPFHKLFRFGGNSSGVCQGVSLMLYYGADATIRDRRGAAPLELALMYDGRTTPNEKVSPSLVSAQNHLLTHSYSYYDKYQMVAPIFFKLMMEESPLLCQIAHLVQVVLTPGMQAFALTFFSIDTGYLSMIIDNYAYVIGGTFMSVNRIAWADPIKPVLPGNFFTLIKSPLCTQTKDFIRRIDTNFFVNKLVECQVPNKVATELILYLSQYGLDLSRLNMNRVRSAFGRSTKFMRALQMQIQALSKDN